jgi:Uma2 family endonuclease
MIATTSTKLMTAEEFFEWANRPENSATLYELVDGEIVEMPSPGERHGTVCANIAFELGLYIRKRKAGQVLTNDTGLVVRRNPDTVRGPDVTLFLEKRSMDQLESGHLKRVPDLIVEVLSPSDSFGQTLRRVDQYLALGVPMIWVLEPEELCVHQFRLNELRKRFDMTDIITGNGVLPDIECRVADFFTLPGDEPTRMPS